MRLDRDASILEHIVSYCEQIELTVDRFGDSYDTFQTDAIYRNVPRSVFFRSVNWSAS